MQPVCELNGPLLKMVGGCEDEFRVWQLNIKKKSIYCFKQGILGKLSGRKRKKKIIENNNGHILTAVNNYVCSCIRVANFGH